MSRSHALLLPSDGLPIEDLERLLQTLDFLLAACNAILVASSRVDARRLELVEVCKCGIKLLLGALQITLLCGQGLRLVLLLGCLVLNIRRLLSLVGLRVGHELVVLLLGSLLCSRSV